MDRKLFVQALVKFFLGVVLVGILIFLPAGTMNFFNGQLLMALLFIPMFMAGIILMIVNPDLLRKRLDARESEDEQKTVVAMSGLIFISAFVLAGLNYRFGWFIMPRWTVYAGAAVFLISYVLYAEVLRENTYLSRTIEVQQDQKVIDTGMYGIVRHPMYAVTILLFLSIPVILGSPISFLIMLLYIPVIAKRIRNEEEVLKDGLQGYDEYMSKVRYRVIPFIW
ncbi:MAG: isoprenylcysteine carboxylmethyltransferase family protein [Oscillospiraceae bacterium]|nr:isoprenylcysteine carboxylmethyltransferase family protein [Oscillospiraceae bacterium]